MDLQAPQVQFNKDKLLEAVQFVCDYANSDKLGNVKLHKILYFADMFKFLETGSPITGVEYIKQKMGPTARHLAWAVKELEKQGTLSVSIEDFHGYQKKKYLSEKAFVQEKLSDEELKFLIEFIDFFNDYSAQETSEISHNEAWQSVRMGEVIPYHSVYRLFPTEIDESDINWAKQEATIHALA